MSIMMYTLRHMKQSLYSPRPLSEIILRSHSSEEQPMSERMKEFKKKLREVTPIEELDQTKPHPNKEAEPLSEWPGNVNPHTGEIGGPKGPEPTRYGDWERKGKCYDF